MERLMRMVIFVSRMGYQEIVRVGSIEPRPEQIIHNSSALWHAKRWLAARK